MFRENKHLQQNLFNNLYTMNSRLAEKLKNSWGAEFTLHTLEEGEFFRKYVKRDQGIPVAI
ncbi:MAG: hypothetical protein ACH0QD_08550 [Tepidibacillus sp.]|uniref:hypothetical protein n=1 Tax=Tepidibacillus infernus TaxID=1806172 RepID=UPI003A2B0F69